jgi:hypothetical protein
MSKNAKTVKNTSAPTVGRPKQKTVWPQGRFTFEKLCILNGALDKEGKKLAKADRRVCMLTLRNRIKQTRFKKDSNGKHTVPNPKSEIVVVPDEFGKAKSEDGHGRPPFIYIRREVMEAKKVKTVAATAKPSMVTVDVGTNADVAPVPAEVVSA